MKRRPVRVACAGLLDADMRAELRARASAYGDQRLLRAMASITPKLTSNTPNVRSIQ